jgi:hypothetical protein
MAMGNGVALERLTNPGQVPDGLLATMALAFLRGLPPAAAVPAPAEGRPP